MKHLLLSVLILSSISATAQDPDLFVKPNGSTDSYVYVNNVELYVENDIELEKNAAGPTEASIYLRNNGQLFQGDDTAQNKGDGMLSVYQTIEKTSAFHYNYWGMPVGATLTSSGSTLSAGNTSSGVLTVYDCDTCGDRTTAGTQTATTTGRNGFLNPDLTISTRWAYELRPSPDRDDEGVWVRLNRSETSEPGYGFIMKGISPTEIFGNTGNINDTINNLTYDLRGRPKNGEISITMAEDDFIVLSGNPYPSVLDLRELFNDNNTLGNAAIASYRFWDEPKDREFSHFYSDKSGGYGTYTPGSNMYAAASFSYYDASGTGGNAPGGGVSYDDQQYTPIGQGFIIVTDGSAGNIEFNNSQRVYRTVGQTEVFHRPETENNGNDDMLDEELGANIDDLSGSVPAEELDPRAPHLRIDVVMEETHGRQLVLGFDDSTSLGFDLGWDGKSPMDAANGEAYFLVGEDSNREPYVINFLNYDAQAMIPIGFKLTKQTKFLVQTVDKVKMGGKKAYIFDSAENTYQEITNGKSATYNLDAGTYDNRFFVVFKGNKELIANAKEAQGRAQENVDFFQNNNLGVLEVTNPEGYNIEQALVFDMTGKLVYQQQNIGTEKRFSFPTSNLSDGVYIVKLKTTDNIDISYKTSVYNRQ